jgi:hypothetical protein
VIDAHPLGRPTLKSKAMGESRNQGAENQRRREDEKFIEETSFFEPLHVANRKIDTSNWDVTRFHNNKTKKPNSYAEFIENLPFKPQGIAKKTPFSLRTYCQLDSNQLFVKALPKKKYILKSMSELYNDEQGVKYFFMKYEKLIHEIFRRYCGKLKKKDFNKEDFAYKYKGLLHHSEFWDFIKHINLDRRMSYKECAALIKEVKMDAVKNKVAGPVWLKGELYLTMEEFKQAIINFLFFDALQNLGQDPPIKFLLDYFLGQIKSSETLGKS